MHISHVCSGNSRWIVPRGSPRFLLQKRKLKQLKSLSVCPVRYFLLLFFLLKRRLREISTYYFVFIFFKCVFTLVIKSALFLNSRVFLFLLQFNSTNSTRVWKWTQNHIKLDSIIRTVTRFEVNSQLPQNNAAVFYSFFCET